MISDRIFGLVVLMVALAFIANATQIQTSFLADPVGPKAFPMLVGGIAGFVRFVYDNSTRPRPKVGKGRTLIALLVAISVLVAYAYALKPLGFVIPTAITAAILSYQISPQIRPASLAGIGLSVGLFVLFKYALDLGLVAFPKGWIG